MHTISDLLQKTTQWFTERHIDSARLDAELLLGHVLKLDRLHLYLDLDRPLHDEEVAQYRALVARRGKFEPVAYLTGEREFYGHRMEVNPSVLIPRPDTECVVEQALELLPKGQGGVVIDVGTGSGCIAIAIALARPACGVIATDISADALEVAARNVSEHELEDRVSLRQGDLLAPCAEEKGVVLVISNPPYIKREQASGLMPDVVDHEPHLALFGEDADGLAHHRGILAASATLLTPGGHVVFEIGFDQGAQAACMGTPDFDAGRLFADYGGNTRGIVFTRQP